MNLMSHSSFGDGRGTHFSSLVCSCRIHPWNSYSQLPVKFSDQLLMESTPFECCLNPDINEHVEDVSEHFESHVHKSYLIKRPESIRTSHVRNHTWTESSNAATWR